MQFIEPDEFSIEFAYKAKPYTLIEKFLLNPTRYFWTFEDEL